MKLSVRSRLAVRSALWSALLGTIALGLHGACGSGGDAASGGSSATGGAPASTGGVSSSGGAVGSGGSGSGGLPPATGGVSTGGSAGATGSGGKGGQATGGAEEGGRAAAGRSGTGGASTGGAPGSGGASPGSAGSSGTDACGRPLTIAMPSGYTKLAWHDEFDADGAPASANWGYENGLVRNEEDQWYQAQNAAVAGGLLTITAKRETKANPNYKAGSTDWKTSRQNAAYTSTSMTTSGKQSWQYGRFEMCAKIPISAGMWPAWWTLGVSGEWPSNGEIDIMEFYNGKILANVACGTSKQWTAKWDSVT
ncbi:MAG TPA: glycoside hydrolase family 16 protein, partial [Polyangia bacterium]|nr:glycoside hydrolase family 16 protein [Polyangia bacterium]